MSLASDNTGAALFPPFLGDNMDSLDLVVGAACVLTSIAIIRVIVGLIIARYYHRRRKQEAEQRLDESRRRSAQRLPRAKDPPTPPPPPPVMTVPPATRYVRPKIGRPALWKPGDNDISSGADASGEFDEIGLDYRPESNDPPPVPKPQPKKQLSWWQSLFSGFRVTPPGGAPRGN
mgnify:CR=1 FL=1